MQSLQGELFTKRVMNTLLKDAGDGLDYSKYFDTEELSLLSRQAKGASPKAKL
jgi:hypothetical protein